MAYDMDVSENGLYEQPLIFGNNLTNRRILEEHQVMTMSLEVATISMGELQDPTDGGT
jgi:hypothetical protein